MPDERTPCQRAALIAYWFGQGEGLTRSQIRKLSGMSRFGTSRLLKALQGVLDIRQDDEGVWSSHYDKPSLPLTSRQRAALIGYEFATKGEARTSDFARRWGMSRHTIYQMLSSLSIVLPIYYDEHSRTWKVLDLRELD